MHPFPLGTLIGTAPIFLECLRVINKVATCDATVLIHGETGTGKELAARAIHYLGSRRDQPFIPINCGAIPDSLVENEVFGHARGAFTDAREPQAGLIALAERGTLFLDEIETLSTRGQVILLRFLEDRTYRPLGGREFVRSNVRVISSSNSNLSDMVRAGTFRNDLLYRLAIVSVWMPPLRHRGNDVLILANYFLQRFASEYGRRQGRLHRESELALHQHSWPGNVRELENLIHREVVMADSGEIRIGNLGVTDDRLHRESPSLSSVSLQLGLRRAKEMAVAEFEKAFISRALDESKGNVSHAARIVGKERRAFGKLLKKYRISTRDFQHLRAD